MEPVKNACLEKVNSVINQSFTGITLGFAAEMGIIDALLHADVALTSEAIAEIKNLKSRYVTEILNCLACAAIVEVDKAGGAVKYNIPVGNRYIFEEKNLPFLRLVSSTATRFQDMMSCVRKDGPFGLPYADNDVTMASISSLALARMDAEIKVILDNTPGLKEKLEKGISVIEFGSGSANLISQFAKQFPNSDFAGSDYSSFSVEKAKQTQQGIANLTLKQLDILNIPNELKAKYDFTFINDVIHDLPDPQGGLIGLRQVLKRGAYLALIEFGTDSDVLVNKTVPGTEIAYGISTFHCVPQAYFSEKSTVLGCCWGIDTAIRYLDIAGFKVLSQHPYYGFFVLFVCQAV